MPAALLILVLWGCSHDVKLINMSDGTTISGTSTIWNQSITLTLPSGEIVEGRYVPLTTASIGVGSLFYGANVGTMLGKDISGRFHGHARLTGKNGTVVEMVFSSDWTGHGFGIAKTNSGKEYRVTF
ncbi:MAG: hypothetical protein AABZ22_01640 [Nitrospirota bacterium]